MKRKITISLAALFALVVAMALAAGGLFAGLWRTAEGRGMASFFDSDEVLRTIGDEVLKNESKELVAELAAIPAFGDAMDEYASALMLWRFAGGDQYPGLDYETAISVATSLLYERIDHSDMTDDEFAMATGTAAAELAESIEKLLPSYAAAMGGTELRLMLDRAEAVFGGGWMVVAFALAALMIVPVMALAGLKRGVFLTGTSFALAGSACLILRFAPPQRLFSALLQEPFLTLALTRTHGLTMPAICLISAGAILFGAWILVARLWTREMNN